MKTVPGLLCALAVGGTALVAAYTHDFAGPSNAARHAAPADETNSAESAPGYDPNENHVLPLSSEEEMKTKLAFEAYDRKRDREMEAFKRWAVRVDPTPRNAFPKLGTCYRTKIRYVGNRFDLPGNPSDKSGSMILYENSITQIGYDVVPEIVRSRRGDRVTLCVVELPTDCPPGDFRGVTYRAFNWRTRERWDRGDSAHMCGGP